MPHAAFILVIFCSLAYVSVRKRKFDALTMAVFSQLVYFFPLILGSLPKSLASSASNLAAATIRQPIAAGTYWLAAILVAATGLAAVLLDLRRPATGGAPVPAAAGRASPLSLEACLLLIAVAGLAIEWLHVGGAVLFTADKLAKIDRLGQSFAAFETGAALACVLAFNSRNRAVLWCGAALLAVDIFIGYRYMAVIAVLSIALLHLSRPAVSVLVRASRRIWLPAICLFLFFLNWPYFHRVIAVGQFAAVTVHSLLLNMEISIRTFEPFMTQSVLDRVVASGFACAPSHFLGLLTLVVPFGNLFGLKVDLVGAQIQRQLFPDTHYGVGSNILAEMLCSFGVPGVVVFSVVFAGTLALLSYFLRRTRGSWQAIVAFEAVLLAFYIYRNDLYYLLLLVRRVLLIAALGYVVQWAMRETAKRLLAFRKPTAAR